MADKRFDSSRYAAKRREIAKRSQNTWESRAKAEEKFLKKQKEKQKYANVVKIITKEILKRENIQYTYIKLYPLIKEIIESSKYLSSRYGEEDIPAITLGVVSQCHEKMVDEKENKIKIEIELSKDR